MTEWGNFDIEKLKDYGDFISSLSPRKITSGIFADSTSPTMRKTLIKLANLRSPLKIVTGFDNPNVTFRIINTDEKSKTLLEILTKKSNMSGIIFCDTPENVLKIRGELLNFEGLDENLIISQENSYREIENKNVKFIIHYEIPESLGSYSQVINFFSDENSKLDCIILASRKYLRLSERAVIQFCKDNNPKEILLSYLGQDEEFTGISKKPKDIPEETQNEDEKILPEDFDFGTANEAQKEAITSTNGAVLILAGPGTGKTYTLVQRTVFLIQKRRVKPENILIATFTDKAANELKTRITEELSARKIHVDVSEIYIGTFHSICARILNDYADFAGVKKNFKVLDEFENAYLIMQNFDRFSELKINFKTLGKWKNSCELRDYINRLTEELIDTEELIKDNDSEIKALGKAVKIYEEIISDKGALSYSEILSMTYKLLRNNPEILDSLHEKIRYIMIDEYQDTNYIQEQIAFMLSENNKNICAAGDDDQSLYRFRGATVRNILEFPDKFNKNECKIIKLILNYRSEAGIIKFFSEWINETEGFFKWENFRFPKKLEAYRTSEKNYPSVMRLAGVNDKDEWHEKLLTFIKELKLSGKISDYNQIAFLFRSVKNQNVKDLSKFLENNNIDVYSPRSDIFFERNEIYFALGCFISLFPKYMKALRAGEYNFDGKEPDYIVYYKNCLRSLARFIDKPRYSELKKWLLEKRSYHENLQNYADYNFSDLIYQLFAFEPFNGALNVSMKDTVKNIRPVRNFAKLIQVVKKFENSYNVKFINAKYISSQFEILMNVYMRFVLDEGLRENEFEKIPSGHVAFMTIHQAKGMEFPVVFIDSLNNSPDFNFYNPDRLIQKITQNYSRRSEFEPENNIKFFDFWRFFYVGFSRAKDILILTCNEDQYTPGKCLEVPYNKLEDAEEIIITPEENTEIISEPVLKKTFSFTSDILKYEICPTQYKFQRELEFESHISEAELMGILIHSTLEKIHTAVINHEENDINEKNISEWFNSNYENLSKIEQSYLSKNSRETALKQILKYVQHQGSDWSAIKKAEAEINLVRDDYIIKGKIDLISIRDGQTEITDFKAGTRPNININSDRKRLENYLRQLNLYAYLVEKTLGLRIDNMKIYYTGETGNNPEAIYKYNETEAEEVVKNFDRIVKRIMDCDFDLRASDIENCRDCDFRFYCGRA